MNLEDHAGDIIRKARAMSDVSPSAAAKAAGCGEAELTAMEESGAVPKTLNFGALAGLIGLNAEKLEGVVQGWLPAEKDLSTWRELRCITTADGGMAVNCYLVWDEVSREGALFDTGWNADPILKILRENEVQLRHIFITHSHEDHIAALDKVRVEAPK